MLAAVDALRQEIGFEFQAYALADYERAVELARAALPANRFESAWQTGSAMSLQEATEYALQGETDL